MYKVLWDPRVGETFIVVQETGNEHDRHAMAVYRNEELGQLLEKISGEVAGNQLTFAAWILVHRFLQQQLRQSSSS